MTESEQVISDMLEMEKDRIKAELEAEKEKLRLAQEEPEEELDLIEELKEQVEEKDQVIMFLKDLIVKTSELHLDTLDKVNTHIQNNCSFISDDDIKLIKKNGNRPYKFLSVLLGGIIIVLSILLWNSQYNKRYEVMVLSQTIQKCEERVKETTKEVEKSLEAVDRLIYQQEESSARLDILQAMNSYRQ